MINTRLYLDKRRVDEEGRGQLRLVVTKNGSTSMLSLGIALREDQWKNGTVTKHEDEKLLNNLISIKKGTINRFILEHTALGSFLGKSAKDIVELLKEVLDPDLARVREEENKKEEIARNSFTAYFKRHLETKKKPGTKKLYTDTLSKIHQFCESEGAEFETLSFNQITPSWLLSFESFCLQTQKQNTAARHLRDIRAVLNAAIDDELTSVYPFRKFKIKHEETRDKSFTSEELRSLFEARCYPGGEQEAIDIFMLMFCLIGINSIDLANAKDIRKGRLEYTRAKTGKPYSIKLEPEALYIIKRYPGKEHLLNILERCPNYKTYFNRLSKTLRKVGKTRIDGKKSEGEGILPDICLGSARTSWATIAQDELDIPREVIQAALGHHTIDVTSTYLRTDWRKKVDAANRKVLDWVFYEKKTE